MSGRLPAGIDPGRAAPLFAALGDATRLQLVLRLGHEGPQSVTRLTEGSGVTRQAVSKHLDALAEAGLVRGRRAGRERIWALQTARLSEAQDYLAQIAASWDGALERLRAFVETPTS